MRRLPVLVFAALALAGLSACGEKPQALTHSKADVAAFEGADNQFPAPAWKRGDKAAWEQGLKARMQNTQNEYSKTN